MERKWKRVALLTLLMGGCFAAGAAASNGIERVEAFLRPDYKVVIDGKAAQLKEPILIYNSSSYIPVRAVSELLGANVNWHDPTSTIYINPRYAGQPEIPDENTVYTPITMEQPNPYVITYLGKDYAVMTITKEGTTYYRVTDLSRMGVDTRSLLKYQETYTGDLYVRQEEADKLWKLTPEIQMAYMAVASGIYDSALKDYLLTMANETIPQYSMTDQSIYPRYSRVFFVDALDDHPGYFYMYAWNEQYEIQVFVVNMEKDNSGRWYQKAVHIINLDYASKFFQS